MKKLDPKKLDLQKLVDDMQKLYAKDKKVSSMITTGDKLKVEYDGIPISESTPFSVLSTLKVLPYNNIVQFAGKPDSGKSTQTAELMISAQKFGAQVIVWDSEHKQDMSRFQKMGGDPSKILVVKTNEILKGGELVRKYIIAIKETDPDAKILFAWDSVGGSQSRSHAERELDDEKHAQPGQDAKEVGSVMKVLVALYNKYPDSIAIYVANQTYAKIGFMQKGDVAAGGTKLEYHSNFIVFLKKIKTLTKVVKGVETKVGIKTRAVVHKNQLTQGMTSIHELDFIITSEGYKKAGDSDDSESSTD